MHRPTTTNITGMVAVGCANDNGIQQASESFSNQVPRDNNNITSQKRWRPSESDKLHGKNRNNLHRRLMSFKLCFLVVTLLTAYQRSDISFLCEAFCPLISRVSPRNFPSVQFHGETVDWRHASTSSSSEVSSSSVSSEPSAEVLLSQSIQLTLSEIDNQFGTTLGISFNSHEERILNEIQQRQQIDAQAMASALPPEATTTTTTIQHNVPYQWIFTEQTQKPLAIQTKGPILEDSTITWIREQSDSIWNGESSAALESRFTYQRKGNYEVHLADLLQHSDNNTIEKSEIYKALQERIYPLVREAFGTSLGEEDPSSLQVCVYDAIVIRYNATEADQRSIDDGDDDDYSTSTPTIGAGQPLHRDLGLVSVNVMLNSPHEFQGGGTFLEHQLQDYLLLWQTPDDDAQTNENHHQQKDNLLPLPLKPMGGPGHALLHLSSDRHAGASTRSGVRDILVFFLTASKKSKTCDDHGQYSTPVLEQAARLKSTARSRCEECQIECQDNNTNNNNIPSTIWQPLASAFCRAKYQHLAVQSAPTDGEAWQYLGMALWDIHQALGMLIQSQILLGSITAEQPTIQNNLDETSLLFQYQQSLAKDSISALEMAKEFTPCDARVYHNFAWILDQQAAATTKDRSEHEEDLHEKINSHYSQAMKLHHAFQEVGCDVGVDYDSTILNYGLYLANQDLFAEAISVLEWIQPSARQVLQQQQTPQEQPETPQEQKLQQRMGLIQDAQRLLSYCQQRQVS